jgi:endonuclease/exonuclease/phosphatase family metal-dependent hydrolase
MPRHAQSSFAGSARGRIAAISAIILSASVGVALVITSRRPTGPAEGAGLTAVDSPAASTAPTLAAMPHRGLRLGTFNIDGGQGTDGRVDLARTASCLQQLDFIGLNEVHGYAADVDPPNQAIAISGLLHLPYLYVPAERRFGHDSFGNAIFSDLPISRWQRVVLPSKPLHALRNYLLTDAMWQGRPIHFITTHVDWRAGGDEQLRIVTDTFLHLPPPAVLLGDLNHPPSSPQIRQLLATPGVEEAIHEVFHEEERPRVDWIFLRGLHTVDAGIVDIGASDHPAFWAEVVQRLNPTTAAMSR